MIEKRAKLNSAVLHWIRWSSRHDGLDIALSDVVEHFAYFLVIVDQKRVFKKTTCSPRDAPSDLQNVKNSPEPPTTVMSHQIGL